MSEPWTPGLATRVLAKMSDARLAEVTPHAFQTWPTRKPLPFAIGGQLISNERAMRKNRKVTNEPTLL